MGETEDGNNILLEDDRITLLYIDDEQNNLFAFKATFRKKYNVITVENTRHAREILEKQEIPVIISDQRMPDETGTEFFAKIKKEYPRSIRILITAFADIDAVVAAINNAEIFRFLTKPWNEADIEITIKSALEIYDLRKKNIELLEQLQTVNLQLEFMLRQNLLN